VTLQYNISVGQAEPRPRVSHATLGGGVAVSILAHAAAIAIAVMAFGRHAPAMEDPATITMFIPPAPPAAPVAEASDAKPVEPPSQPEAVPDYTLPSPEESLAVPDFKSPPPPPPKEPPPKVATPQPKPPPPKPVTPQPPVAAAPQPAPATPPSFQPTAPVASSAPPSAAAIVPGWNVQLASWLASHKRYPSAARERSEEGEVLVSFTVDGEGHVSGVSIAKSSGHRDLDQATLAMLQGATLPPPGAAATRTVRVHYRLDD
jgi:protein TonB